MKGRYYAHRSASTDDELETKHTVNVDETGTFVPYDHLTSRTDLLETTGWLVRETKDPAFFETTSKRKARVSWVKRVLGRFTGT